MDRKQKRKESHNKGILFFEQEEAHIRAAKFGQKHVETMFLVSSLLASEQ